MWSFIHEIHKGDMIILPRKRLRVIAVGRVSGEYQYREELDAPHVRPVDWEAQDIPRSDFDQDLLNSMGGLATVFRVRASDAESRIDGISAKHLGRDVAADAELASLVNGDAEFKVDLEEQINDRIIERIRQRFSGTRLEYLVAEILRASGYSALETRPGPDGGIDVVAGQGDMGFGHPRLCVQVKSGRNAVDLPDYNRLQGNIGSFGAEHGLLVSLGDFTRPVRNENERSFFQIRLWGPNDLVERLLETYDDLPDDIRSEIPLRNRRILIETE
jgi:restriction system protein